jgi:hypothetical protein
MVQAKSRQPLTTKGRVRSHANRGQFRGCQSNGGKGFSLSTSVFPLSVTMHEPSTFIFMYMLLLPEGQSTDAWEPSKKQCSFGNRETLDRKVLSLCSLQRDKSNEIIKIRHVYKLRPPHTLQSVSEIRNITAIRNSKCLL